MPSLFQVASVIPSSPMMIRKVASKMDLSRPCVVAEYGPGEGCHTRELLKRAHPDSRFLLFELDPEFCRDLERQFADDKRVDVICADCATLPEELAKRDLTYCDYIFSGIPFSTMEVGKKRQILRKTHEALKSDGKFIIYQVTNELRRHATPEIFPRAESEYFLANVPPMFITVFHKDGVDSKLNGNGKNGHPQAHRNGHKRPLAADRARR
jgi:phosphatidylethanolamine/phosphatidyl-N-methylethanolamine N-methyltransferase